MGALIAVAKVLASDDPITPRLFISRVILGSFVSVIAGAAADSNSGGQPAGYSGTGGSAGYCMVIRLLKCGCADVQRERRTGA
ncbi:phage holin family protein [Citrobacter freundii]|uniref:phage holin family protein n=1 Tax=Citrobacter freundii TaxID=546 RepID=UPI001F1229CA|nr:phage holin family protein [Citrobacter freundii]